MNPDDIPAGHVDIYDTDRLAGTVADFDENNPEDFIGQTVKGRYKVSDFLGGDETGLAYLADDKIVEDKKVLVRILLDGETDEMMESILAEERISLSHLTHPNIARLDGFGTVPGGRHFLVSGGSVDAAFGRRYYGDSRSKGSPVEHTPTSPAPNLDLRVMQ